MWTSHLYCTDCNVAARHIQAKQGPAWSLTPPRAAKACAVPSSPRTRQNASATHSTLSEKARGKRKMESDEEEARAAQLLAADGIKASVVGLRLETAEEAAQEKVPKGVARSLRHVPPRRAASCDAAIADFFLTLKECVTGI